MNFRKKLQTAFNLSCSWEFPSCFLFQLIATSSLASLLQFCVHLKSFCVDPDCTSERTIVPRTVIFLHVNEYDDIWAYCISTLRALPHFFRLACFMISFEVSLRFNFYITAGSFSKAFAGHQGSNRNVDKILSKKFKSRSSGFDHNSCLCLDPLQVSCRPVKAMVNISLKIFKAYHHHHRFMGHLVKPACMSTSQPNTDPKLVTPT